MPIATILFKLSRKRLLVAGAAFLGLLAGTVVAFRITLPPKLESRQYQVGTATTRILIDTPSSQVIALDPTGIDTLAARANLVANLMVDGAVKTAIAQRAGVRPSQLVGTAQSAASQLPNPAPKPRGYVLTTRVTTDTGGNQLPIVEIGTQAPDASGAARLADAAVAGLQDYLNLQAAHERVPGARRLQVTALGPAQAIEVVRGPRKLVAVGLGVFVFLLGCAAILVVPALRHDWRAASEGEGLHPARPETTSRHRTPPLLRSPETASVLSDDDDPDLPPVIESPALPRRATARSLTRMRVARARRQALKSLGDLR